MTVMAYVWLIIAGVAALLFFGLAMVLALRGVSELRDLLRDSKSDLKV
jgi:hypothetical protein